MMPVRRSCRLPLAALFLTASAGILSSQAVDPAGQQAAPPPTFRSGTDLVTLDIRVTDANGRPIKDLRREELQVSEDGRARPVVWFQHVAEPDGDLQEAAQRTVASEVSTNVGAPRGHLYVLVFDQHHITAGNEQPARLAAERFLKHRLRAGDRVALYALPGPGPQIPFTRDARRVADALLQVRGSLERTGVGVLGTMTTYEAYQITRGDQLVLVRVTNRLAQSPAGSDVLRGGLGGKLAAAGAEDPGVFKRLISEDARNIVAKADEAARRFLLQLTDVMREVRTVEGRKTVVVLSEGFYSDGAARELEQTAAAAAESYSVIHALDLNRRGDFAAVDYAPGGDHQADIQSRLEPLGTLAVETDGLLVNDAAGRLQTAFDQLSAESQDYYIAGFEPSPEALKRPDVYHRVKVSVSRPGARVSTRTGYSLVTAKPTPADRRRAIDLALRAPFPQQGLPIEFTTYVLRGETEGQQRVVLSLAADLPVASATDTGTADVVFVVRRATDGQVVASGSDVMPLPRTPRKGSTIGRGTYRVQFDAPPGLHVMRVVVREPGGLAGSADRHFKVRPLATRDVTTSDLIFGGRFGGLPVRPAAVSGSALEGVVELYARSPADLARVDVTVQLLPVGDTRPVMSTHANLLDVQEAGGGVTRVAQIDLPLEGTEPGAYLARAMVRADGETVTELLREIEVLPPSAAPAPSAFERSAPDPLALLEGEVVRLSLESIRDRGPEPLRRPATLALARQWEKVEPALPVSNEPSAAHAMLRGLAHFARGQFDQSVPALEAAASLGPDDARAAFILGWAYAGAGDIRQAIGAWRNAARLDPLLVPAHLALADTFVRLSQPELALQAVRAGLAALPTSPELLDRLARLGPRSGGHQ